MFHVSRRPLFSPFYHVLQTLYFQNTLNIQRSFLHIIITSKTTTRPKGGCEHSRVLSRLRANRTKQNLKKNHTGNWFEIRGLTDDKRRETSVRPRICPESLAHVGRVGNGDLPHFRRTNFSPPPFAFTRSCKSQNVFGKSRRPPPSYRSAPSLYTYGANIMRAYRGIHYARNQVPYLATRSLSETTDGAVITQRFYMRKSRTPLFLGNTCHSESPYGRRAAEWADRPG